MKKFLYWIPRILSALITLFWMSFVFLSHGLSWETLIESGVWAIILLITILAWKNQIVGKLGFIALGIFYIILTKGDADFIAYFIITGPLFLIGILFLLDKSKDNLLFSDLIKKLTSKKSKSVKKVDDKRVI